MKKTEISKALTYEWITVHTKKGVIYQRRQRKKVQESTHTPEHNKAERLKEWQNRDSLAGLKDHLAQAIKYNRNYYNNQGNPIYVPDRYKDIVEEIHHSKNNSSTFTNFMTGNETDLEKQKKTRLIGLIKLKDKLFAQELKKKQDFNDKFVNNPETIKRNINSFLGAIHKGRSGVADMLYALNYTRDRIDSSIDPTIQLTYEGKTQEKSLDEVITRLKKSSESKDTRTNTGIESLKIKDLDNYEPEDFVKQEMKMDPALHSDIVNRINRRFEKLKKE
jgi:hypothetical protein